jgi:hypothetical protein
MLDYLYGKRFGSSRTFSRINTSTFSNLVILHTYPPMKMEQTECSETSAYKIKTSGNYPEGNTQHNSPPIRRWKDHFAAQTFLEVWSVTLKNKWRSINFPRPNQPWMPLLYITRYITFYAFRLTSAPSVGSVIFSAQQLPVNTFEACW